MAAVLALPRKLKEPRVISLATSENNHYFRQRFLGCSSFVSCVYDSSIDTIINYVIPIVKPYIILENQILVEQASLSIQSDVIKTLAS